MVDIDCATFHSPRVFILVAGSVLLVTVPVTLPKAIVLPEGTLSGHPCYAALLYVAGDIQGA